MKRILKVLVGVLVAGLMVGSADAAKGGGARGGSRGGGKSYSASKSTAPKVRAPRIDRSVRAPQPERMSRPSKADRRLQAAVPRGTMPNSYSPRPKATSKMGRQYASPQGIAPQRGVPPSMTGTGNRAPATQRDRLAKASPERGMPPSGKGKNGKSGDKTSASAEVDANSSSLSALDAKQELDNYMANWQKQIAFSEGGKAKSSVEDSGNSNVVVKVERDRDRDNGCSGHSNNSCGDSFSQQPMMIEVPVPQFIPLYQEPLYQPQQQAPVYIYNYPSAADASVEVTEEEEQPVVVVRKSAPRLVPEKKLKERVYPPEGVVDNPPTLPASSK